MLQFHKSNRRQPKPQINISRDNHGSRVVVLQVGRSGVGVVEGGFRDMEDDEVYAVAVTSFLTLPGKSGFGEYMLDKEQGPSDYDAFYSYTMKNSPLTQRVEGRITINYITSL